MSLRLVAMIFNVGELIVSNYVTVSIKCYVIGGRFGHIVLCQLLTKLTN